jgi:prepilin-type N-terminal cleavage/methylation domain-containing protein
MQSGAPRAARGFTLIELLVAVAVVAIVVARGALAWPEIEAGLRLEAAVHQIAADLHDARGLAVASAARTRLVFAAGATRYRVEHADDEGAFVPKARRDLPRGVRIGDVNSGGDLVFTARGNAENGTVTLVDRRGARKSLRLNQRGRVTVDRTRT